MILLLMVLPFSLGGYFRPVVIAIPVGCGVLLIIVEATRRYYMKKGSFVTITRGHFGGVVEPNWKKIEMVRGASSCVKPYERGAQVV